MKNNKNNKQLAGEWFFKAEEDRRSIEAIFKEDGAPSTACFLSQQMAEKYLKGFLVYHNRPAPKIHDLTVLLNLIKKIDDNFFELEKNASLLSRYYITARYPADFPEGFSMKMAREAFEAAQEIKNFILNKI